MLTICWAAKGGSGTTVVAAGIALSGSKPALLVDAAGDLALALGVNAPGPGLTDWLASDAPPGRLERLEVAAHADVALIPYGSCTYHAEPARWGELADHLAGESRHVVVDAGINPLPRLLAERAAQRLLVMRNCYLNVHAAIVAARQSTGIVLVEEPGRRLGAADIEAALDTPVVTVVLHDPAIARAADSGLALSRLPRGLRLPLARAAAGAEVHAA